MDQQAPEKRSRLERLDFDRRQRMILGLIGAAVLVASGIWMLDIRAADSSIISSFINACGVMAIGLASIPLLLIKR